MDNSLADTYGLNRDEIKKLVSLLGGIEKVRKALGVGNVPEILLTSYLSGSIYGLTVPQVRQLVDRVGGIETVQAALCGKTTLALLA